jgi:hypothetical protein
MKKFIPLEEYNLVKNLETLESVFVSRLEQVERILRQFIVSDLKHKLYYYY